MCKRLILAGPLAGLLFAVPTAGVAKQPRLLTKTCQVPAGKTITCTLKLPRTGKYRSVRYDLSYTLDDVVVAGATPPDLRLVELPDFELAPFDEEKIDAFIQGWYSELARLGSVPGGDAADLTHRLQAAVRRPDLWPIYRFVIGPQNRDEPQAR